MTKEEFLNGLRTALAGEIPDSEVYNNIRFYEDYIRDKSISEREDDVVSQLGDPRLIAKTIIEAYQISHGPLYNNARSNRVYQDADTSDWDSSDGRNNTYQDYENNRNGSGSNYTFHVGGKLTWYQKVVLISILILIFVILIIVGGFIVKIFFTVGVPILLIYLVYRLIFGNRRL